MIEVSLEPLERLAVEAVLRPVDSDWSALSPAMRRLELAAGAEWAERLSSQGELPVGSALISDAGELPSSFVIHVAIRSGEEPVSRRSVDAGLRNALRRAEEWGLKEIGLPLLGTGPGNLDPEDACRTIAPLLRDFAGPAEAGGGRAVVCCADRTEEDHARRILADGG